jgi:hypothetical protein
MPSVHLLICYETNDHRAVEYKVVDETLCPNTSTHIQDDNDYIYSDVHITHPRDSDKTILLKIRMLKKHDLRNLVVWGFETQQACEAALSMAVEQEIEEEKQQRESFDVRWESDEHQSRVRMMKAGKGAMWWNAVRYEME